MANPLIGAEEFVEIDREHAPVQKEMREITRPNVDGIGLQDTGARGHRFDLLATRDFTNEAAFIATQDALRNLLGALTSWKSNGGTTYPGLAILRVETLEKQRILTAVGGLAGTAATWMVTFRVRCIDTRTP